MFIELIAIAVLALGGGLFWHVAQRRSARDCALAAYDEAQFDATGAAQAQQLQQAFPDGVPEGIDALLREHRFRFLRDGGFVPDADTRQIEQITTRLFGPDAARALQLLERYGPNRPHPGRVHLALLKTSGGQLPQLDAAVQMAVADWQAVCRQAEQNGSPQAFREYVLWLMQARAIVRQDGLFINAAIAHPDQVTKGQIQSC